MTENVHPRLVIVGPGALGSVFAAHLARAGFAVSLLGRDSAHLQAIRSQGLTLHEEDGTVARLRLDASDEPRIVAGADVIVVLVKTGDTETAMRDIAPFAQFSPYSVFDFA